ncbi:MAG: hypothetical protein AAF411_26530 [Myxococcota bacterium]
MEPTIPTSPAAASLRVIQEARSTEGQMRLPYGGFVHLRATFAVCGCMFLTACSSSSDGELESAEDTLERCSDGRDNDGDGLFDALDDDCELVLAALGVGDSCLPENVPPRPDGSRGFDGEEVFLETGSVQCQTGLCLVFNVEGDPTRSREECIDEGGDPGECALAHPPSQEIDDAEVGRVFCSCRCDRPEETGNLCACPNGFICSNEARIEQGSSGLTGSYCVRDALVSM